MKLESRSDKLFVIVVWMRCRTSAARIVVQVTLYRRFRIVGDDHLDQS